MPPPENNDVPVNPAPVNPVVPVSPAPANAAVNATPPAGGGQVGVFVTTQSLVTFPVATAVVTTIWKVLVNLKLSSDTDPMAPIIISLVVGLLIYLATVSHGTGIRQKIVEAGVALINTFTIAAAAIGIGK